MWYNPLLDLASIRELGRRTMDRLRSIGERKAVVRSAKLLAAVLGLTLIGADEAKLGAQSCSSAVDFGETEQFVAAGYANLPLSFEPNLGRDHAGVRFLAHGPGYTLFLSTHRSGAVDARLRRK